MRTSASGPIGFGGRPVLGVVGLVSIGAVADLGIGMAAAVVVLLALLLLEATRAGLDALRPEVSAARSREEDSRSDRNDRLLYRVGPVLFVAILTAVAADVAPWSRIGLSEATGRSVGIVLFAVMTGTVPRPRAGGFRPFASVGNPLTLVSLILLPAAVRHAMTLVGFVDPVVGIGICLLLASLVLVVSRHFGTGRAVLDEGDAAAARAEESSAQPEQRR